MTKINSSLLFFLGRRVERLIFCGVLVIVLWLIQAYLTAANKHILIENPQFTINALLKEIEIHKELLDLIFEVEQSQDNYENFRERIEKAKDQFNNQINEMYSDFSILNPWYIDKAEILIPKDKKFSYKELLKKIEFSLVGHPNYDWKLASNYISYYYSPDELINNLKKIVKAKDNPSMTFGGIEIPRSLQFHYANQRIELSFQLITSLSTIAVSVLSIGWLFTFQITRGRELSLIYNLDNLNLTFPHLLNFYNMNLENYSRPRVTKTKLIKAQNFYKIYVSLYRIFIILIITLPILFGSIFSLAQLSVYEWMDYFFNPLYIGRFAVLIIVGQVVLLVIQELGIHHKIFQEGS